jgi:UPF0716 family protein affecting phage T7 exclusion
MRWIVEAMIATIKEGTLINVINVPVALIGILIIKIGFTDAIGLLLLIEATGLMLAGGAMELGGTASARRLMSMIEKKKMKWEKDEYERVQRRAAVFTMTGLVLFLESLFLALFVLQ